MRRTSILLLALLATGAPGPAAPASQGWPVYAGDAAATSRVEAEIYQEHLARFEEARGSKGHAYAVAAVPSDFFVSQIKARDEKTEGRKVYSDAEILEAAQV